MPSNHSCLELELNCITCFLGGSDNNTASGCPYLCLLIAFFKHPPWIVLLLPSLVKPLDLGEVTGQMLGAFGPASRAVWSLGAGASGVELPDGAARSPRQSHRVTGSSNTQGPTAWVCSSLSIPWAQRDFCSITGARVSDLSICC